MLLNMLIRNPKSLKENFDIHIQPLIEELKQLWNYGAQTYDVSKKQNFDGE